MARVAQALIPLQTTTTSLKSKIFRVIFLIPPSGIAIFSRHDFDAVPDVSPLIRQAYLLLHQLTADELGPGAPEFWAKWKRQNVEALIPAAYCRMAKSIVLVERRRIPKRDLRDAMASDSK
jgi:hypothetical protein